jgi:hypothetical protein
VSKHESMQGTPRGGSTRRHVNSHYFMPEEASLNKLKITFQSLGRAVGLFSREAHQWGRTRSGLAGRAACCLLTSCVQVFTGHIALQTEAPVVSGHAYRNITAVQRRSRNGRMEGGLFVCAPTVSSYRSGGARRTRQDADAISVCSCYSNARVKWTRWATGESKRGNRE